MEGSSPDSGLGPQELGRVLADLAGPRPALVKALPELPRAPGLYAVYGSAQTWADLRLGLPPDERPLYVGKSESSLHSREVLTHFSDGKTGWSTVRRTFAALLRDSLGLRGIPRNPAKPDRFAHWGLSQEHDRALTAWMRTHLSVSVWRKEGLVSLAVVETQVLREQMPPANLTKVRTAWSQDVTSARAVMAQDARAWASQRGFAC